MSKFKTVFYGLGAAYTAAAKHNPPGRNIYDTDWDICIILDSTRVDMLQEVYDPPRDATQGTAWSRGSITTEWLSNTFRPAHEPAIAQTGFVSATPHSTTTFRNKEWLTNAERVSVPYPSNPIVNPSAFDGFYEVWRSHATENGVVPPGTMLDATIEAYDRHERVAAHWLQPHEPFISPDADILGGDATEKNVWDGLNAGELDPEDVWQSYMANLEYALQYVNKLLQRVDATVLLTSDHGNAFGEWGIYGHPFAWPQPEVRKVPWYTIDATPTVEPPETHILESNGDSTDRDEQLRALGYR